MPARPEEEVLGLLLEASFYFLPFSWVSMWLYITFYISTPVLFHLLGIEFVEEGGCSPGRGPEVGNGGPMFGGLWLRKDGGGSGRIRVGRFLWAPEGSNVEFLCVPSPTSLQESLPHPICHLPPQESQKPKGPWSC